MSKNLKMNTKNDSLHDEGSEVFMTEKQLALRWQVSVKKIQKDRINGGGIQWVRIGRLVRYRLSDVLKWETDNTRVSTSTASVITVDMECKS